MAESNPTLWVLIAAIFILGALLGSFLNVVIARVPKGESIVRPPSRCPRCKTPIAFYDNIPLVSYALLGGRCRACGKGIAPRYFLVELLTGVLAAALFLRFGPGAAFVVYLAFAAALVAISFIDLDARLIPDAISLPGVALGLIASFLQYPWPADHLTLPPSPVDSVLGILLGGGLLLLVAWLYELATGAVGMGGGDIKLLAMIGAFLGWPAIPLALFFASLTGAVVGLALMVLTGAGRRQEVPFGPFLCAGALFYIFLGRAVVQFYLPPG